MKSTRSAEHISYFKTIRELKFHGKSSVVTHLLQRCTYDMLIAQYEVQGASFLRAEPKKLAPPEEGTDIFAAFLQLCLATAAERETGVGSLDANSLHFSVI